MTIQTSTDAFTGRRGLLAGTVALALAACGGGDGSGAGPGTGEADVVAETRWGAVTSLRLTRADDDGAVPGFNLDDVVSGPDDGGPCPYSDKSDPDGRRGIDNQLAELTPILEQLLGGAVEGLIQGAVNEGRLLLLFELAEAPAHLTIQRGDGKPYLGTDGMILDSQTFNLAQEPPLAESDSAEVDEAGEFVAAVDELTLPVSILRENFDLHMKDVRLRLTPNDVGGWDGLLGGGFPVETMVDVAYRASQYDGERLEGPLRALADLEPVDGACTRMSAALHIQAVPAYVFPEEAAPAE